MIVAFTGHRPNKLGGYDTPNPIYLYVCQRIEETLRALRPDKVVSGMALGVDQWAATIAHNLDIPFIAAVPFEGQDRIWPASSRATYKRLIELASEVIVVTPGGYSSSKMQTRNEWMVNYCDKLIAVWDGTHGGTGNCVKYAQSKNKEIIYIKPQEYPK